jgi:energy-coupling factor transporter ATP-binding protein EcfA2
MTNNDIFKKLRVALQLRDDQIVEILELVDFRISKGELGNIFRKDDHKDYMECGDQLLRNFLNGLVIHLRGTKENPKNPNEVIKSHKPKEAKPEFKAKKPEFKTEKKALDSSEKKPFAKKKNFKNIPKKIQVVEKVKFKNGKPKE